MHYSYTDFPYSLTITNFTILNVIKRELCVKERRKATRFSLNDSQKRNKKEFIKKKKKPEGKTKISVQQSRNVRLATIVSPIDRRNDRTCSKKKENFSPRPFHLFPAPRFFPRRFTFISAFLAFRPFPFPFASLSPSPRPTFSSSTLSRLSPQLLLTQLGLSPLPETKR